MFEVFPVAIRLTRLTSDISRLVSMDSEARHHFFIVVMAAIEWNDTFTASCIHRLFGDQPPDQPYFLNYDVSGLIHETLPLILPSFPNLRSNLTLIFLLIAVLILESE